MAFVKFKVTRKPAVLVAPSLPTPREFLYLSNIDDQPSLRFHITSIHFYRYNPSMKGQDPARVIKEALAKVLVLYYPFAGRLRDTPEGKLLVDCTGEGALFIEAEADVAIDDFGDVLPPFPGWDGLLHDVPGSRSVTNSPVLLIQVTRLTCGGFIIALRMNHTMNDATGYVQFMNALGEMAKGSARPSVRPVWKREILRPRTNPTVKFPHYEYIQIEDKDSQIVNTNEMIRNALFFGPKEIESLKRQAVGQGKCTTFEFLSAYFWRLRTRALQIPADKEARLLFPVDARKIFDPPLPEGFYGNAICLVCARTTAGNLANESLSFAVSLIHQAKMAVNDEYMRSMIDMMELKGRPCWAMEGTLVISDVTKIGFGDVDFGWGRASYAGPILGVGSGCFFIPYLNTSGVQGILISFYLPSAALKRFEAEILQSVDNGPTFLHSSL